MYIDKLPFLELVAACRSAVSAKPYLEKADRFMRIHRSYIIALGHIAEASRTSVRLDNDKIIPVGELYRPEFGEYLASLGNS